MLGNGMFVFCFVQGVVACVAPFVVDNIEYGRDCAMYLLSALFTLYFLLDGKIVAWEGGAMLLFYALYVLMVFYFDTVRAWAGIPRVDTVEGGIFKNERAHHGVDDVVAARLRRR